MKQKNAFLLCPWPETVLKIVLKLYSRKYFFLRDYKISWNICQKRTLHESKQKNLLIYNALFAFINFKNLLQHKKLNALLTKSQVL